MNISTLPSSKHVAVKTAKLLFVTTGLSLLLSNCAVVPQYGSQRGYYAPPPPPPGSYNSGDYYYDPYAPRKTGTTYDWSLKGGASVTDQYNNGCEIIRDLSTGYSYMFCRPNQRRHDRRDHRDHPRW